MSGHLAKHGYDGTKKVFTPEGPSNRANSHHLRTSLRNIRKFILVAFFYTLYTTEFPVVDRFYGTFQNWMRVKQAVLDSYKDDDNNSLRYWAAEFDRAEWFNLNDVYTKDGYIYFYDQGGPVLNAALTEEYDHLQGHRDWFKSLHQTEWNQEGDYTYRNIAVTLQPAQAAQPINESADRLDSRLD